jgi:signal transduction histidine kinase
MLLPTSPEFLALCQSQLQLLTQGIGASMGVLYLAEEGETDREPRLVPIAASPEITAPDALPPVGALGNRLLLAPDRLVLPLNHDGMVLGLLVTERLDRQWIDTERQQVEQVAQTLALSCVLDQRSQWLEQQRRQDQGLLAQQHDRMDNLLHQFRNPLTAMRTFGKLMMRRLQPGDSNHGVAVSIVRESDRLQELLLQFDQAIDLLPVGTIEVEQSALPAASLFGEAPLVLESCDLVKILQPLLMSAGAMAQEKGLAMHSEFPQFLPSSQGNAAALREVLSNLIDNAIKYTPRGQVHVRVVSLGTSLGAGSAVYVTDSGLGIPGSDLPRLFERHFRGVQAGGEIPGTGLGLAIARDLVRQMGGEIEVFSPALSQGWIGREAPEANGGTTVKVSLVAFNPLSPTSRMARGD